VYLATFKCARAELYAEAAATSRAVIPPAHSFKRDGWRSWRRYEGNPRDLDESQVICLSVSDENLYRNICGATLDAHKLPCLSSTPLRLRWLLEGLKFSPRVRNWLIATLLWIFIRVFYCAHDYWEHHGYLPVAAL
jgi:hypothetical protein